MKGHGTKFGRKKEAAVVALLTHRSIDEAAKAVGVAPNTLLNWMKDREFAAVYRKARAAVVGQAIARLQQTTGAAVSTLQKLMVDASTPPAIVNNARMNRICLRNRNFECLVFEHETAFGRRLKRCSGQSCRRRSKSFPGSLQRRALNRNVNSSK